MASMRMRRFIPLMILGLLHVYIGVRLLPDLAEGPGVRVAGAVLLMVSCGLMLAGLMSRSMQYRAVADRVRSEERRVGKECW